MRWRAAVAAALLGALAAPAPAGADGPSLSLTDVHSTPGRVALHLTAAGLPGGVSLARAEISVYADETPLSSSVRAVPGTGAGGGRQAVVLVVDVSGSMAGERIEAARSAAAAYGDLAPPGVAVGVVTVADAARVALPPTADRAAFRRTVARLAARGATALYDGVDAARRLLDPAVTPAAAGYLDRRILVLSDGEDTSSRTPLAALPAGLAASDAVLDAVAFGEADSGVLTGLAEPTGGRVHPAANGAGLRAVFRTMAAGLSPPLLVEAVVPPQLGGRAAKLRVQAVTGGLTLAGSAGVVLRPDPAAAVGPREFTAAGPGGALARFGSPTATVAALAGAGLFGVLLLLLLPLVGRDQIRQRVGQLDRYTGSRGAAPGQAGSSQVLQAALSFSERVVTKKDRRERIELALDRAGSDLRAAEWALVRAAAAAAGGLLGALLLPWWAGLPLGLLLGWLGTAGYLRVRTGRRVRAFAELLPEALQLVVGSLRSGFSLPQSIDAYVREGEEPVAGELARAMAETRLGGDLEDALERVADRNASQDMSWLVMAIRIQREVGGNLSEALETAVETMRERGRLFRHVRALSAEGRLSAWVLLGIPVVLGGWMFLMRNEYVRPLYTEPVGIAMLAASVVQVGIGALWLRKLVNVEV